MNQIRFGNSSNVENESNIVRKPFMDITKIFNLLFIDAVWKAIYNHEDHREEKRELNQLINVTKQIKNYKSFVLFRFIITTLCLKNNIIPLEMTY